MRTWMTLTVLGALLAAGCQAPAPMDAVPVLFPVDGEYELVNPNSEVTGYIFAETQAPGRQMLRWILLDNFVPPRIQPVGIQRATSSGSEPPPHETADEFADFAREQVALGSNVLYAKSYADTFFGETGMARKIVELPIPQGRRPPDPPGSTAPWYWPSSQYQQLDDGTIGIKPGSPPEELPPGVRPLPVGGGGYLPPKPADPTGIIGMVLSSPTSAEQRENWFIPGSLFSGGVNGMTLLPFSNQASPVTDAAASQWVVVVVNSSYYPGYVPNDD